MQQTVSAVTSVTSLTIIEQLNSTRKNCAEVCNMTQCHINIVSSCHLSAMSLTCHIYVLNGHTEGNHSRGRPKKRWLDNVAEDCEMLQLSPPGANRLAHNRSTVENNHQELRRWSCQSMLIHQLRRAIQSSHSHAASQTCSA